MILNLLKMYLRLRQYLSGSFFYRIFAADKSIIFMAKDKKALEGKEKEHKKPWQETYATVEEIKAFLRDHVYLRFHLLLYRQIFHPVD